MPKTNKRKWTMRDGTKILIAEMSDNHLLNSIKLFEKVKHCKDMEQRKRQVKWLIEERNRRLGIVDEGPVQSRLNILDIRKADNDGL